MKAFLSRLFKTLTENFTSRKLWMTVFALWINWSVYWAIVYYIPTFLKPEQLTAFTSITTQFYWTNATMLLAYLGVNGLTTWGHSTASSVQQIAQNLVSKSEHRETREDNQRIIHENGEKYRDDPSYAPVKKDTEAPFR